MDYVIIVAGGKGLRMGSDIPKQFLPIGGKPVLMRTLERFREYSPTLQIILVLPKAQQDYWRQLCQEYAFPLPSEGVGGDSYLLADGGETRFHSVQHGLALIPDDVEGVVGVHDGVRPFPPSLVVSTDWYRRLNASTSNCSKLLIEWPTVLPLALPTTPVWSKLSATTSPLLTATARTSRLLPLTTSPLPRPSSIIHHLTPITLD